MVNRIVRTSDAYDERIRKLIPAEITAAFVAINSIVPQFESGGLIVVLAGVVLVGLSALYLYYREQVTDWVQVAFTSVILFPVWAVNIAYSRILGDAQAYGYVAAVVMILVTVAAPLIVRAKTP